MKKIVILDGYAANSGDLIWAPIEELGELTVYHRTAPEEVVPRCENADIALFNKALMDATALTQLPHLKYIGILATGYNTVDTSAARKRGIPVCNAPGYGTDSVAQHVFALLLELTNQVALHSQSTSAGEWSDCPDWTYRKTPMIELSGKTMGIVGLGRIGGTTAAIARSFGMKTIAYNPVPRRVSTVRFVSREQLFAESDVISLHCPLTDENRGFVNEKLISTMKPTAFLINTGRGPLIDEQALANALNSDRIAGAGLDVLSEEPPARSNPLFSAKNCLITPHNAWGTRECRERLIQITADNLRAFFDGNPQNVVN